MTCDRYRGTGWVCADHPLASWDEGCAIEACGAGARRASAIRQVEMPPGTRIIA